MATYIPAPDVAKVTLEFLLAGQTVVLTFHFHKEGGFDITGLNTLLAAVIAYAISGILPGLSEQISLFRGTALDLTTQTSPSVQQDVVPAVAGTSTSPSLPNNAALVVTQYTDQRGRSFRGRNYIPGLPQSDLEDPSHVTPTQAADWAAVWADLFSTMTTGGYTPVVTSYSFNKVPRTTAVSTPISSVAANNELDSQRRRLAGRGR